MTTQKNHNAPPHEHHAHILDEMVSLTEALIRFKTMHGRMDEIKACASFIEDYLDQQDIVFSRTEDAGYPSILVLPDINKPVCKVLFMAHIDVVDAADNLFEPTVRQGRLYGRGSVDDKYAVALSLTLLKTEMIRLRGLGKTQADLEFGVLITSDEEIGGHHGVGVLAETLRPEFCIALDGGAPDEIVNKEKGLLTLKLTARGKAAHGSRPWKGDNAIDHLIADYTALKNFFGSPGEGSWCKTLNLGIINAGKSFNQVPDRAEAIFDIRYTEHDDTKALFEALQNNVSGKLTVLREEPMFMGGTSPYLDRLRELAPDTRIEAEHGSSDGRFFSEKNIPGIIWGAAGGGAHAENEYVETDSILSLFLVLQQFVEGL